MFGDRLNSGRNGSGGRIRIPDDGFDVSGFQVRDDFGFISLFALSCVSIYKMLFVKDYIKILNPKACRLCMNTNQTDG